MGHSLSQFILDNHNLAKQWNNNYIIALSVQSEKKLINLLTKLNNKSIPIAYFTEPDLNDELTSICFLENEHTKKLTSSLPLSLKNHEKFGQVD